MIKFIELIHLCNIQESTLTPLQKSQPQKGIHSCQCSKLAENALIFGKLSSVIILVRVTFKILGLQ